MFGKPAPHGRGKYYKNIWLRSSYEVAYAKYLDKNGIQWEYEPTSFDLGDCTYAPDFYLPALDLYIEVKGYWRSDAKIKFNRFLKKYPSKNIIVLDREALIEKGVIK